MPKRLLQCFIDVCLLAGLSLTAVPMNAGAVPPDQTVTTKDFWDVLVPRRPINSRMLGLNAFVNDPRFGSIAQQFKEVRSTLGIRYVRVLFAWNDQVQPSPSATPNFSFYDDIAAKIPRDVEALVVLTSVPSWMADSRNWVGGNPRTTFVERWVKPVVSRYARNSRLKAFEIWNEPNMESDHDNTIMGLVDSPENYVEMLSDAASAVHSAAPGRIVVSAATTAINQNYPDTLDYNERMIAAGAASVASVYAIHYYGKDYQNVLLPGGIEDVLNTVSIPIWLTESGAKGTNAQRNYVERTWPFLKEQIPALARTYYYQFTEATPASQTYGLKNLTRGRNLSDLYIALREKRRQALRRRH